MQMYCSNNKESTLCQLSGFMERKNPTNQDKQTNTHTKAQTKRNENHTKTNKTKTSTRKPQHTKISRILHSFVLQPLLNYVLKYSETHDELLLFILELSFTKQCHDVL